MTDWLTLRALSLEIPVRLRRARVESVELDPHGLRLGLRGPSGTMGLAIDLRPQMPPLYPTKAPAQSRKAATLPLQVLRRALLGARLEGAFAPFGERLLQLCFLGRNRFGDPLPMEIVAEFFGTRPDILLTEEGVVSFALHGRRWAVGQRPRLPLLSPPPARAPRGAALGHAEAAVRAAKGLFAPTRTAGSPPRLDLFGGDRDASVLDALGSIARDIGDTLRTEQLQRSLRDRLARRLGARQRTLMEKRREYRETEGVDLLLRQGEALKLALRNIPSGSSSVRLPDPYAPDAQLEIALDPERSATDNMEALFRRHRKLRSRRSRFAGDIEAIAEEIRELERLAARLGAAGTFDALMALQLEVPEVLGAPDAAREKKGDREPQGPLRFVTVGGHDLLVGRSAQENERLTRAARPSDLWFHAKDRQGAHCILRPLPGRPVGAPDRLEAALIAAFYSKGRQGSQVPVDYTLARHLRKARGAGPGHFLYDHHETLFVTPDAQSVDRIRNRRGNPRS